jgi:hypothetical protein
MRFRKFDGTVGGKSKVQGRRLRAALSPSRLEPAAPPIIPAAANKQNDQDDNEQCGRVHLASLFPLGGECRVLIIELTLDDVMALHSCSVTP